MIKTAHANTADRRRRRVVQALAASPLIALAPLRAAEAPLRMGTSTPGGGFHLYGQTLERVLNADTRSAAVTAVATRGSEENLQRLAKGELDAALIQGTSASQALNGKGDASLRVLYAMYPSPGMLAVRGDSTARRFEDLKGQPVVFGVAASGLVLFARQVFAAIGLDIDRDFDAIYVEKALDAPQRVIDGEAAALWGAGEGWPGFTRLAQSPRGARFIGPGASQVPRILAAHPFLKAMEVPAGAYPGLERELPTVGSWNLILARADLPEARAYAFVRAMHQAAAQLALALPQASMSTSRHTVDATPSLALLHPGTTRLLRELKLVPG